MYEIFPMSDQAKSSVTKKVTKSKYPWQELAEGQSFAVPHTEGIKLSSLVSLAARTGTRHRKLFKVVNHEDRGVYEVAYVRKLREDERSRKPKARKTKTQSPDTVGTTEAMWFNPDVIAPNEG